EGIVKAAVVVIIKEQAAHAARFAAVLEVKVLIAPAFETRIDVITKGPAGSTGGAMPVAHIVLVAIVGCQVKAAAKPPHRRLAIFLGDEKAHIGVTGRCVGIARMNHQRDTHGLPVSASQLRSMGGG